MSTNFVTPRSSQMTGQNTENHSYKEINTKAFNIWLDQ